MDRSPNPILIGPGTRGGVTRCTKSGKADMARSLARGANQPETRPNRIVRLLDGSVRALSQYRTPRLALAGDY